MNYDIVIEEHQKFIDDNLKLFYGEKKNYVEWCDSRSLSSKRFKKRIIVIGEYRIISVKKGKVSISVNKNIHFYDISDIIVVEDTIEIRQKQLSKNGDQIGILIKSSQKETLQKILKILRDRIRSIQHNFPPSTLLRVNSPETYLLGLGEKQIGIADGFIEIYKAQSSYRNHKPSTEVIRLVEKYVSDCVTDFDLSKCPGLEGKSELNFPIEIVILSLNYNCYFQSIILNGNSGNGDNISSGNQKNVIHSIGEMLNTNCFIKKISVYGMKDEDQTLLSIGQSLSANTFNNLSVLDLHSNQYNLNSFQVFCDGLESMTHPLRYLNLSDCNLNPRSIELLFQALTRNTRMSSSIEYLNLSNCKFDEIGSNSFCLWIAKIKQDYSLKFLYLSNCSLNLVTMGSQIRNLTMLRLLDISNNRFDRSEIEELIGFIKNSKALESLNISNCNINHDYFLYVTNTFNKNQFLSKYDLNVSGNQISKSPNIFISAIEFLTNINCLNLSQISISYKSLIRVLDSIRLYCKNISSLLLDSCFQTGHDKEDGMGFISELKQLLNETPSLKQLSISGDHSNYLSTRLMIPFLEYLAKDNATLEQLNISYSHLGDQVTPYLANLFEYNSTLKSILLDRNGFTINTFQTLLLSLQNNHSLVHLPFPNYDFEKILISLSTPIKKSLLFNLMYRIQTILEENGGWRTPDPHYYPTPNNNSTSNGQQQQQQQQQQLTISAPSSPSSQLQLQQPQQYQYAAIEASKSKGSQFQHLDQLALPPPPTDYTSSVEANYNNNYYYDQNYNNDDYEYYSNGGGRSGSISNNKNRATLSPTFRAGGTNNNYKQQQQNQPLELTDSFVNSIDHLNDDELE